MSVFNRAVYTANVNPTVCEARLRHKRCSPPVVLKIGSRMSRREAGPCWSLSWACAVALGVLGCSGSIISPGAAAHPPASKFGNPSDPAAQACAAAPLNVPFAALQRMTALQYLHTQQSLFAAPALALTLDAADSLSPIITELEVEKINGAAAVAVATGGQYTTAPCDVNGTFNDGCAQTFIQTFGARAFRRPLDPEELAWLTGVYQSTKTLAGITPPATFKDALDAVSQVLIQAPQHLYLSARGVADALLPSGILRMTDYERATRLAYLLTNNTPDATLLATAAAGKLGTADEMRAQAQRLVDSPAGHVTIRGFAFNYLGLGGSPVRPEFDTTPKDLVRFPFDSPALRADIVGESEAFLEHVFYDLNGSFEQLMTSTDAALDAPLASLYGASLGPTPAGPPVWTKLDPTQRAGIFTRAAFLAEMANQNFESPIQRGVHLFKHVLCMPLGPPPPNANNNQPPVPGGSAGQALSVRQQTDLRTSPAACQACHAQLNPLGFTLNHYDAMGRWQTADTGVNADGSPFSVTVDSNATLPSATGLPGTLSGGVALSAALAHSAEAQKCVTGLWFSQALGRSIAPEDDCTVRALQTTFQSNGGDMRSIVLDAASSPPALYVRASP